MSAKQKIVHGHGLSNINLGIFVCSFDVCRASKPVPSINYANIKSKTGFSGERKTTVSGENPLKAKDQKTQPTYNAKSGYGTRATGISGNEGSAFATAPSLLPSYRRQGL